MKVAFIGAGNVAWHLAQALTQAGHQVTAVYSRHDAPRQALAKLLPQAQPAASLQALVATQPELILIAVPDDAIAAVALQLQVQPGTVVVHTSGAQPISVLAGIAGARTGVFYPLQTFSKAKPVAFGEVPLLLEATQQPALALLQELAQSISGQVHQVSSAARSQLHLAAVFACNFTNHLLGISQQLLHEAGLPLSLLQPLIYETIAKALQHPPFEVQTGPAARHDNNVITTHLNQLAQHPRYQEVYLKLTESIQHTPREV